MASMHAIAVVISESSGNITVHHEGNTILEIEKPMPRPHRIKTEASKTEDSIPIGEARTAARIKGRRTVPDGCSGRHPC
jgi:hypothetical protein